MFSLIANILKVLNSEASPLQVGMGVAFGLLAGLLPFGLLTLFILLLVCLFTINLSTFILTWGLSGGLMLIFGSSLEALTWQYAQSPGLLNLLASSELLQALHLHHTLVLGAFIIGLIIFAPAVYLSMFLIRRYRSRVMPIIQKWKITQVLKATKVAKLYDALS